MGGSRDDRAMTDEWDEAYGYALGCMRKWAANNSPVSIPPGEYDAIATTYAMAVLMGHAKKPGLIFWLEKVYPQYVGGR
jgi:hypothetical protein